MNCPYCGSEMQSGSIHFDGRSRIKWKADGQQPSFWDSLGGIGCLAEAEYGFWGSGSIKGTYCSSCKKLIIDTEIQK